MDVSSIDKTQEQQELLAELEKQKAANKKALERCASENVQLRAKVEEAAALVEQKRSVVGVCSRRLSRTRAALLAVQQEIDRSGQKKLALLELSEKRMTHYVALMNILSGALSTADWSHALAAASALLRKELAPAAAV